MPLRPKKPQPLQLLKPPQPLHKRLQPLLLPKRLHLRQLQKLLLNKRQLPRLNKPLLLNKRPPLPKHPLPKLLRLKRLPLPWLSVAEKLLQYLALQFPNKKQPLPQLPLLRLRRWSTARSILLNRWNSAVPRSTPFT